MNDYLGYGKHWIDESDIAVVVETLKSDWLTQGPKIDEFERIFAEYVNAKYAVAVSNGTAALHIAVQALDIEKGKTGITSPITFAASSNCFLYNGLNPNFADIDECAYCIDPAELKKKITPDTKVVIPVHFAGQICEMEKIAGILGRDFNTGKPGAPYIIEDASHALGSVSGNRERVGSCQYSDMTVFSFHPVKTIATGEGGMITTTNRDLYEKLRLLRTHGITKQPSKFKINDPEMIGPWYYEMQELGFNYRVTDIQAALGISQMRRIEDFVERRLAITETYNKAFKNIEWLTTPYETKDNLPVFHLYVLKIDFKRIGKTRTQVMEELNKKGIGTQVHYVPVHLHPYYRENYGFKPGDFPKAEQYYRQCLSIPLYPKMKDEDIARVIDAILKLKNESNKERK